MLTWAELQAGVPCRGCARPIRDSEPWVFRGGLHLSPDERVRYEAQNAKYKSAHGTCQAHRWSIEGSLTTHCGRCCPPPPLSAKQIKQLQVLLRPMANELNRQHGRS